MLYAIASFPALVGEPIAGVIKEGRSGYMGVAIFAGVSLCVGGLVLVASRFVLDKRLRARV